MSDWQQVGDVALEIVARTLTIVAANTDNEDDARAARELALEITTTTREQAA